MSALILAVDKLCLIFPSDIENVTQMEFLLLLRPITMEGVEDETISSVL